MKKKQNYINNPLKSWVEWCGGVDNPPPIYSTKEAATSPPMHTKCNPQKQNVEVYPVPVLLLLVVARSLSSRWQVYTLNRPFFEIFFYTTQKPLGRNFFFIFFEYIFFLKTFFSQILFLATLFSHKFRRIHKTKILGAKRSRNLSHSFTYHLYFFFFPDKKKS